MKNLLLCGTLHMSQSYSLLPSLQQSSTKLHLNILCNMSGPVACALSPCSAQPTHTGEIFSIPSCHRAKGAAGSKVPAPEPCWWAVWLAQGWLLLNQNLNGNLILLAALTEGDTGLKNLNQFSDKLSGSSE